MEESGDGLVAGLHGKLLRKVAKPTGMHHQGLRSAASHLRRLGAIDNGLAKKLTRIDDAFAATRHLTSVSSHEFLSSITEALFAHYDPAVCLVAKR